MSRNGRNVYKRTTEGVTSRKGRVSRNGVTVDGYMGENTVTSRKGRVSRNELPVAALVFSGVTSRKGRVSRNVGAWPQVYGMIESRPARGV